MITLWVSGYLCQSYYVTKGPPNVLEIIAVRICSWVKQLLHIIYCLGNSKRRELEGGRVVLRCLPLQEEGYVLMGEEGHFFRL